VSRRSRDKGNRIEREIVNLHRAEGLSAERVPLSGAAGGSFAGDLIIDGVGRAEVKARAGGAGFVTIEGWLADHNALFLRRDRVAPLVVLPWQVYLWLLMRGRDNDAIT
jgi:Holliday junction resolvase